MERSIGGKECRRRQESNVGSSDRAVEKEKMGGESIQRGRKICDNPSCSNNKSLFAL